MLAFQAQGTEFNPQSPRYKNKAKQNKKADVMVHACTSNTRKLENGKSAGLSSLPNLTGELQTLRDSTSEDKVEPG